MDHTTGHFFIGTQGLKPGSHHRRLNERFIDGVKVHHPAIRSRFFSKRHEDKT